MDKIYLTYDDVLCVPSKSLESRESANIKIGLFGTTLEHPIIPANMDTISGEEMCRAALDSGGIAILHRFMSTEQRMSVWDHLNRHSNLFISIGVSDTEKDAILFLHQYRVRRFCIDIAHGHSDKVAEIIKFIRSLDNDTKEQSIIIAGNVATSDGFSFLIDAGADIVKVGIGPGSHCTTRIVTGCGVPQFSAIQEIVDIRDFYAGHRKYCPIIADGGIKNSGDIVKAIGAGADFVMSGSLFAGCAETPGETFQWKDGSRWKMYRGMASKDAQVGWKNTDPSKIVAEGESSLVPEQGKFADKLFQLIGGLKSGMSYIGAKDLEELRVKTKFIRVSSNTLIENGPHGKRPL